MSAWAVYEEDVSDTSTWTCAGNFTISLKVPTYIIDIVEYRFVRASDSATFTAPTYVNNGDGVFFFSTEFPDATTGIYAVSYKITNSDGQTSDWIDIKTPLSTNAFFYVQNASDMNLTSYSIAAGTGSNAGLNLLTYTTPFSGAVQALGGSVKLYKVTGGSADLSTAVTLSGSTGTVPIPYAGATRVAFKVTIPNYSFVGDTVLSNTFTAASGAGVVPTGTLSISEAMDPKDGLSLSVNWTASGSSYVTQYSISTTLVGGGLGTGSAKTVTGTSTTLVGGKGSGAFVNGNSYAVGVTPLLLGYNGGFGSLTTTYTFGSGGSGGGDAVPCIPAGQRVLTKRGLVAVEELKEGADTVVTEDGRALPFKRLSTTVACATEKNAPVRIVQGSATVELSPDHMLQLRAGVWARPGDLVASGRAKQVRVGEPVTYYHIALPNYLRDNLVVEGFVTESFGGLWVKLTKSRGSYYTWSEKAGGYVRSQPAAKAVARA